MLRYSFLNMHSLWNTWIWHLPLFWLFVKLKNLDNSMKCTLHAMNFGTLSFCGHTTYNRNLTSNFAQQGHFFLWKNIYVKKCSVRLLLWWYGGSTAWQFEYLMASTIIVLMAKKTKNPYEKKTMNIVCFYAKHNNLKKWKCTYGLLVDGKYIYKNV